MVNLTIDGMKVSIEEGKTIPWEELKKEWKAIKKRSKIKKLD